jgi:signal transduction histidine kinase
MRIADPILIPLAVIGVLYLVAIGFAVKRRGLREPSNQLLLLYLSLSLLWLAGHVATRLGWFQALPFDVAARIPPYGLLILSLVFLHLGRAILRLDRPGWPWWVAGGVWLALVVILELNLLGLPDVLLVINEQFVERSVVVIPIPLLGWGLFTGAAVLTTLRAYRRTQQPLHKNRITYWSAALFLTVLGAGLLLAGGNAVGHGLHALGALSASSVVLAYHLPDVRQMVRRAVSFLLVTLLAGVIYTLGFLGAHLLLQNVPGYTPLWAGATMALVLAALINPVLGRVQRWLNELIVHANYDSNYTLREYSMNISNVLDLERLARVAVETVGETMNTQRGALFVVHYENEQEGGNGCFRLRGTTEAGEEVTPVALSASSPVAATLRQERQPLTQYDIDLLPHFQDTSPVERAWLSKLNMDVYVPIYSKGEWIGLLALGPKASGDRYFDTDLALLSTLADQTAVALQNARLFDDLKLRSAEIERLNEELSRVNQELARLDKAKSDFINVASHELRTPLTHIRGCNDILSGMLEGGTLVAESGLQLTDGVKKSVRRLEEIVNTMFDVSRIDTATLALNLVPTPIAPSIRAAVDELSGALEERKQTLSIKGVDELPTIVADNKRLEQVFSHLIQNAIKFTPDGGQIRIAGRLLNKEKEPEEQEIEVVVADSGIGIATEDHERVFEKFYRVGEVILHSTGRTKYKGAGPGLGLTIARGIVEAHGGRIWVESPGHDEETCPGSQFHVVLPLQARCPDTISEQARIAAVREDAASCK